jgi:hypothetical protein
MIAILMIFGVVAALAGAAALGYGTLHNGFDLGNTLLIAGTIAFIGGLALLGLAEAVRQLRRISESLMVRPVGRVPRGSEAFQSASEGAPSPGPRIPFPPKPEPRHRASAAASRDEARLDIAPSLDTADEPTERSSSDYGRRSAPEPRVMPALDEAPLLPQTEPRFAASENGKDELAEGLLATAFSRLDVSHRPASAAAEPSKEDAAFDAVWPNEPGKAPAAETRQPSEAAPPESEGRVEQVTDEREADAEPYAVSILKSGVVDGMAYTLYSDGSIEAELPQGTMRFPAIADLRAYLEQSPT